MEFSRDVVENRQNMLSIVVKKGNGFNELIINPLNISLALVPIQMSIEEIKNIYSKYLFSFAIFNVEKVENKYIVSLTKQFEDIKEKYIPSYWKKSSMRDKSLEFSNDLSPIFRYTKDIDAIEQTEMEERKNYVLCNNKDPTTRHCYSKELWDSYSSLSGKNTCPQCSYFVDKDVVYICWEYTKRNDVESIWKIRLNSELNKNIGSTECQFVNSVGTKCTENTISDNGCIYCVRHLRSMRILDLMLRRGLKKLDNSLYLDVDYINDMNMMKMRNNSEFERMYEEFNDIKNYRLTHNPINIGTKQCGFESDGIKCLMYNLSDSRGCKYCAVHLAKNRVSEDYSESDLRSDLRSDLMELINRGYPDIAMSIL